MRSKTLKTAVPVRFSAETAERLESVKERTNIPVAQLIRIATEALLDEIERTGKIEIALNPKTRIASIEAARTAARLSKKEGR